MEEIDLNGYLMCHADADMHSVLYEQRIIRGLTQKQVAERAKVTLQQYQKFESGDRNILTASFRVACKIIEALGMDITSFYHGKYVLGEEVYIVGKRLHYRKTRRPVDEDVQDEASYQTGE